MAHVWSDTMREDKGRKPITNTPFQSADPLWAGLSVFGGFMKNILIINQRAVIESGIKGLDAVDLLLFDCLAQEISRGSGERLLIGNVFWRHVSYSAMQKLLPLVNCPR